MVRRTMKNGGIPFVEVHDEAAFYGPKIDVQIWSAIVTSSGGVSLRLRRIRLILHNRRDAI